MLWVLLAASLLVFVIACSNVANLILARTIRREGELVIRTALGASNGALRRVLLAESLPALRRGSRTWAFSARGRWWRFWRATLPAFRSALWTSQWIPACFGSAPDWHLAAAALLAFVPRPQPPAAARAPSASPQGIRAVTGGANGRLRAFAIHADLAHPSYCWQARPCCVKALLALQAVDTGIDTQQRPLHQRPRDQLWPHRRTGRWISIRRRCARSTNYPASMASRLACSRPSWREGGRFGPGLQFTGEGYARGTAEEDPRGQFRIITPGFFAALRGVPGRGAARLQRPGPPKALNRSRSSARASRAGCSPPRKRLTGVTWTDPVLQFTGMKPVPMRVIGVAADIDDEHLVPRPTLTVYTPFRTGTAVPEAGSSSTCAATRTRSFPDHAHDPQPVRGPARGAGRPSRGCSRGGAHSRPAERPRFRRIRGGGSGNRSRGRGRRARLFRERTHPRIRHTARHRFAASPLAGTCDRGRVPSSPPRALGRGWQTTPRFNVRRARGSSPWACRERGSSPRRGGSAVGRSGRGVRLARPAGRTRRCVFRLFEPISMLDHRNSVHNTDGH